MPSLPRSLMAKTLTKPRLLPPRATRATHNIGSKSKLRPRDIPSFAAAQPPLFREVACAVCTASVLPRKELYEAWAVATRVDDAFPGYTRVADLAAGHGLLAWLLLLLAWERGAPRTAAGRGARGGPCPSPTAKNRAWPLANGHGQIDAGSAVARHHPANKRAGGRVTHVLRLSSVMTTYATALVRCTTSRGTPANKSSPTATS